jgi:hypothetical protein
MAKEVDVAEAAHCLNFTVPVWPAKFLRSFIYNDTENHPMVGYYELRVTVLKTFNILKETVQTFLKITSHEGLMHVREIKFK